MKIDSAKSSFLTINQAIGTTRDKHEAILCYGLTMLLLIKQL